MVDDRIREEEKDRIWKLMEKRGEEVLFGKCGKPQERFDLGEHNGRTFCEVHLGDPGYCEWALGQDSKVCQLTCFKYFLRRVGVMMVRDERHREEGRGERGDGKFKRRSSGEG